METKFQHLSTNSSFIKEPSNSPPFIKKNIILKELINNIVTVYHFDSDIKAVELLATFDKNVKKKKYMKFLREKN